MDNRPSWQTRAENSKKRSVDFSTDSFPSNEARKKGRLWVFTPMSEVLEYDGEITMVSRCAQELLGYHFSILHRPARTMIDVDSLTRRFGNLTSEYIKIGTFLSYHDRLCRPAAYTSGLRYVPKAHKIPVDDPLLVSDVPILTCKMIDKTVLNVSMSLPPHQPSPSVIHPPPLSSVPIMLHSSTSMNMKQTTVGPLTNKSAKMKNATAYHIVDWLCIDDVCGSFIHWSVSDECGTIYWKFSNTFTCKSTAVLFPILFPYHAITQISDTPKLSFAGLDAMFIPYQCGPLTEWLFRLVGIINDYITYCTKFKHASLWAPHTFLPMPLTSQFTTCLGKLAKEWG